MIATRYLFQGVTVIVHLYEVRRNQWTWAFTLDSKCWTEEADITWASSDVVLANGMRAAQIKIQNIIDAAN
jgi:hypothetical protein